MNLLVGNVIKREIKREKVKMKPISVTLSTIVPAASYVYLSLRRGYRADEKKAIVSGKKVSPDIRQCCMTNSLSVTTVDRVFG